MGPGSRCVQPGNGVMSLRRIRQRRRGRVRDGGCRPPPLQKPAQAIKIEIDNRRGVEGQELRAQKAADDAEAERRSAAKAPTR
jgi:hypothetical protein